MQPTLPPGLQIEGPTPVLPLRAVGAVILDARGQTIANCPNAPLADFLAWSTNVLNQVHPA